MATIVSDIDGTVLMYGEPMKPVIAYIKKKSSMDVIFLTNRPEAERRRTIAELKKVGIPYKRLIMNDMKMSAPKFKKMVIEDMLADKENPIEIAEFIDDRIDNRNAIRSIGGIKVTDPAEIMGKTNPSKDSYSKSERIVMAFDKANEAFAEFVDLLAADSKTRDVVETPSFIRENAKRGLELNKEGYGGDGLTDKTKQEARDMASGKVTIGKCVRMAAWFARHKPDTQADGFKNKKSPDYPSAGLVAWLLWGGDSNGSMRAAEWAEKQVERFTKNK
jgi:hypothetical protein